MNLFQNKDIVLNTDKGFVSVCADNFVSARLVEMCDADSIYKVEIDLSNNLQSVIANIDDRWVDTVRKMFATQRSMHGQRVPSVVDCQLLGPLIIEQKYIDHISVELVEDPGELFSELGIGADVYNSEVKWYEVSIDTDAMSSVGKIYMCPAEGSNEVDVLRDVLSQLRNSAFMSTRGGMG